MVRLRTLYLLSIEKMHWSVRLQRTDAAVFNGKKSGQWNLEEKFLLNNHEGSTLVLQPIPVGKTRQKELEREPRSKRFEGNDRAVESMRGLKTEEDCRRSNYEQTGFARLLYKDT